MLPQKLRYLCVLIYGDHWRTPLANAFGVTYRSVHRWAQGEANVPPTAKAVLLDEINKRREQLNEAEEELKK